MSFVLINAARLASWLPGGGDSPTVLQDHYTDLELTASGIDSRKGGPSGGACMALAMAQLLGYSLVEAEVGITGAIDLRGRVHSVGALKEKCQHACRRGVDLMCVPSDDLHDLEEKLLEVRCLQSLLDLTYIHGADGGCGPGCKWPGAGAERAG